MEPLGATDILMLWERGAALHPVDRSVLLCAWARPGTPIDAVAELPLGAVTRSLLALRATSFGSRIDSHVSCEHCGQRLEVVLETASLLDSTAPGPDDEVLVAGMRLRAPRLSDLAVVAHAADPVVASRTLLRRCIVGSAGDVSDEWADERVRDVEAALESLDPNGVVVLDIRCEACARSSPVQVDAAALLWDEIDLRARELLGDVHLLARTYGWSEADILRLSPPRRAAYRALIDA